MSEAEPAFEHPVRDKIAAVLREGEEGGEPAAFDETGLSAIRQLLEAEVYEGERLVDAVEALLVMAHTLEVELESPTAAARLIELVDDGVVFEALRALQEAAEIQRAEEVRATADRFDAFRGRDESASRVSKDDEPNDSGIRVGDMAFPKRL